MKHSARVSRYFFLVSLFCCSHAFSEQFELELGLPTYLCSKDDSKKEGPTLFVPDQLASLTSDANQLIGGVISPLSGNPCLKETDLTVAGAQEIVLARIYIAPYMPYNFHKHWDADCYYRRSYLCQHYEGWKHFPHLRLWVDPQKNEAHLTNSNAATYDFSLANGKTTLMQPYAASNLGDLEIPSGRFDPKNTSITYDGKNATVFSPDGSKRYYAFKNGSGRSLLLEKEILPNGKILRYQYSNGKLSRVESLDPKERYIYASINLQGDPEAGDCKFNSSTGLYSSYHFEKWYYSDKFRDQGHEINYSGYTPPLMTKAASPQYRSETATYTSPYCLLESFSGKEKIFSVKQSAFGEGNKIHFRVDKLLLPVGQKDAFTQVYEMAYQPTVAGEKEGKTTIKNIDGTSAVYHFSKNLLTTLIQHVGQEGVLKKEKIFTWNNKGWLTSVELRDGNKRLFLKKNYEYDGYGNPITETLIGDLQGNGAEDTYKITREFSQDGRNLLLKEETEEGRSTIFEYLSNTNLMILKLIKERDYILIRESFRYDDCHNLIRKSIDDGNSQKMITDYILRQQQPFLHMPEWIEEKYLDKGIEKLLKRTHLTYDQWGHIVVEKVHDANGEYAYSILKEYNERGDLLSETNPLGQKHTFAYDDKGQCIESINFSQRLKETMCYDKKGRVREYRATGIDGIQHITKYDYNHNDDLIQKIDSYANIFSYVHDPLTHKIISTHSPDVSNANGSPTSVIEMSLYDAQGREISKTDANGNTKLYCYNAYSLPIEISYPNGSKEAYRYTKSGKKASYTNRNSLTVNYTYDLLDRIISKDYGGLGKEISVYDNFHLLQETDLEGNATQYSYNGAGKKIREAICGRITEYTYDSLGRVSATSKNGLITNYKMDLEGHIIEENKVDAAGDLLSRIEYGYNDDGYLAKVIRNIDGKSSIESFTYDSLGRGVEHQDPLGNKIIKLYNENHTNNLEQKVLQVTTINPHGISTVETKDPFSRLVKEEIINLKHVVISSLEKIYDPNGNMTHWRENVYEDGHYINTQTTKFTYGNNNKIESCTRAFGTPEARTTQYSYTNGGQVQSKLLPDGTLLSYDYDSMGFLRKLISSDGKINHQFKYNMKGELLYAFDGIEKITIQREVDSFGNVIKEIFPHNIIINKEYDYFDRLVNLQISNFGSISYTYNPLYLKSVSRFSADGKLLYTHQYDQYDLDGNLLVESMICNAGKIKHFLDLKGRKVAIFSSYFSQKCEYDSCDNLINKTIHKTPISYTYDDLSQLTRENDNSYRYDSLFNRVEKNESLFKINNLNELTNFYYDLNGNQTQNKDANYAYDSLNRLISATVGNKKVHFLYDPLGRRLSKVVMEKPASVWNEMYREHYLYDGQQELGAITQHGILKNFRVLGTPLYKELPATISIEINKKIFAPTMDVQANICQLIDPVSKTIVSQYEYNAFGESRKEKNDNNPWRYAAKRFDPELNLIYFGKRYYNPLLARWLTMDPADFLDGMNLYQYAFNNPYSYYDPDGNFIFCACIPFALLFTPAVIKICVDAVAIGIGCWGAYQGMKYTAQTVGSTYTLSESTCHDIISETLENKKDRAEKADSPKKKKPEQEGPRGLPANRPDYEKRSSGYMQKQIEQGRAPRTVERIDKGRGSHEKDHVHFKDGSAMNSDGTWKHGGRELSRQESEWLKKNGWQTPEQH